MKSMFWTMLTSATLTAGCAFMGPSDSSRATQTAQLERGHSIAVAHCASCHAIGAAGDSPAPEAPTFRTLSQNNFRVATLEQALTRGITTGHPPMPDLQMPQSDADALVAYLQSVQSARRN